MTPTQVFFSDLAITVPLSGGIVAYVQKHLRALLVELCGTTERANFWLAFSNVALVLVPLIFTLDYKPESGPDKTWFSKWRRRSSMRSSDLLSP